MILSFNGRANIGIRIAQEKFPEAKLAEVHGVSNDLVDDPNKLDQIDMVFLLGEEQSVNICSTGFAEFGPPELVDQPYRGCMVIEWPIEMDLAEAQALKEAAGFNEPYNRVTLRHLMQLGIHPCFIFNSQSSGFIFVDTVTKKVSPGEPPRGE